MKKILIGIMLLCASLASADYLGSWAIDDYITISCVTHQFSTGAEYIATTPTYSVYEDDTTTPIIDAIASGVSR